MGQPWSVGLPQTYQPTAYAAGEGRGVSTSSSPTVLVKPIFAIKITEDALRHIGRDAHFFRAGLGGSAYTTVAHFSQIPGSNRPCLGGRVVNETDQRGHGGMYKSPVQDDQSLQAWQRWT